MTRAIVVGRGTRLFSLDRLRIRVWMWGPRWRSSFGVRRVLLSEIAPESAPYHRPGKTLSVFTLEDDVRERICDEIRPGVYAQWSDPRDTFGRIEKAKGVLMDRKAKAARSLSKGAGVR